MPTQRSRSARPAAAPRRYGCEVPRVWTPPLRKLTRRTTLGFEVIDFAEDVLGIELLPWQKWLLIHALELLPDGTPRFRTVVVLVARQNGKSTLAQVLALWHLYVNQSPLVIGTAQNLDVAEDVWKGAVEIAQGVDELADEIERVVQVNGKKALELTNGSRYKVQAANRRGGRGLSGDFVILDELREHQSWQAWAAVSKTTLARAHAQVWALSNAGDSASVVLRYLRRKAHLHLGDPDGLWTPAELAALEGSGSLEDALDDASDDLDDALEAIEDESLGLFEWSAEPGRPIRDREGWAQANPSMGYTITERAIAATMSEPEPVVRTEVLCQWVDGMRERVISDEVWAARRAPELLTDPPGRPAGLVGKAIVPGVDVSPGHASTSIAVAGYRPDGEEQVEVIDNRPGLTWAVARLVEVCKRNGLPLKVALMSGGLAGALVPDLLEAGFEIEYVKGAEETAACGAFYVALHDPARLRHLDQPVLNAAVMGAGRKYIGDGAWKWNRTDSTVDISPLVAATAARHVLTRKPPPRQRTDEELLASAY